MNKSRKVVLAGFAAISLPITQISSAWSGPLLDVVQATGLLEPVTSITGVDPVQVITPVDSLLSGAAPGSDAGADPLQMTLGQLNNLLALDALGDGAEISPLAPITEPLGQSLAPLVDAVDTTLDPLTDPVDDQLVEPVLGAVAPLTDPLLEAVEPLTNPVDGIVSDLTGGNAEDSLTNIDDDTADGNGVVNDLLGGTPNPASGTEAGEASPLPLISQPLGNGLSSLVDTVDTTLDPLTDAVDDQLLEPVLDAASPLTEPLLAELEPVTDPVDGLLADVTGGSAEDALTNNDDNSADGNGAVNDLLGGTGAESGGADAPESDGEGTFGGGLIEMLLGAGTGEGLLAQSTADGDSSPLAPITAPLGDSLTPLVDALDTTLDPLTDAVDDQLLEPVLDAAAPLTEPLLAGVEPVTNPVDGLVADLTGGSVEDALTNNDDNTGDGNGAVNDLLGGAPNPDSGTEAGEASPLPLVSEPLGEELAALVDTVDTTLNPLTDAVDDQLLEPVLDAASPLTEPLLDTLEPVTDPVDGLVADLTGGSVEDALTNNDDNTADGNGAVNDLLNGNETGSEEAGSESDGGLLEMLLGAGTGEGLLAQSAGEDGEASPLAAITDPLGDSLAPLVDTLDTTLDPLTDAVDDQLLEPVLDAAAPLTEPLLAGVEPVTDPVDGLVADLTGGSVEDALTNNDDNSADGNGAVNDLLGGDANPDSGSEAGEASPLPLVSDPLGEELASLIDAVDTTLDPLTDVVDDQLLEPVLDAASPLTEPVLDALEPVTDPVDGLVADLTGGSVEDALTNNDDNTADGNGAVNDLLGGGDAAMAGEPEGSPLAPVTGPLGDSLDELIDVVDNTLDPLTDPIDDQLLEPVLDAADPLTEPLLDALEPVTDPVDGLVADLTGGSVEDALTNNDGNTDDGNGAVNDLLGGDDAETEGDTSPLEVVTAPLGDSLESLVDTVDQSLDPITDSVDGVLDPVVGTLDPVTDPLVDAVGPVTGPVDNVVADVTGGSVEDALTNNDTNTADGNGVVNDILGNGAAGSGGTDDVDGANGDAAGNNLDQPALIALLGLRDTGRPDDADGDGVADADDRCPRSVQGASVAPDGCEVTGLIALLLEGVRFDTDKAEITPAARDTLLADVEPINQLPYRSLEIAGHTDARGGDGYNENLAKRRSQAVVDFLIANGVEKERLVPRAYGEAEPIADNDSDDGRYRNRRAELIVQ